MQSLPELNLFFGMSDMQFGKAQVRAVKAKTGLIAIGFSIGEGNIRRPGYIRF